MPLLGLSLFLGFYPRPVLDRISPSVNHLVEQVDLKTGTQPPHIGPVAAKGGK